jgi:hypothetical protein
MNKTPGLYYALTNDGVQLPVIDVTHPTFAIRLTEPELDDHLQQFIREVRGQEKTPAFLRQILYSLMRRRSVLARGLMGASGTFMSGMNTYLMKLGPDHLDPPYFSDIDRRIAASPAALFMRLRLQDMAELLAAALLPPLAARPGAALHLLNIGGGADADSLNALILIRNAHPGGLLVGRKITIHCLDLDTAGPAFGARALAALRVEGAPLSGLDIDFHLTAFNWSNPADLRRVAGSLDDGSCVMAVSSEGALFEYGSDADVAGNLRALHAVTPEDTPVVGSVTRADNLGRRLNGTRMGSRAALYLRGLDAFRSLALDAGWRIAECIDRPLSHAVRLVKLPA